MDEEIKSTNFYHRRGLVSTTYLNVLHHSPRLPNVERPSVLLLPFWGGSASTFRSVLSAITRRVPNAIVFAVSYPGTGQSPPPDPDNPEHHNIPMLAEDMLSLLQETAPLLIPSGRVIICAHSMSAKVSIELLHRLKTTQATDRPPMRVDGLVLLGPAPPAPFELPKDMQSQQLTAYQSDSTADWVMRNVLTHRPLSNGQHAALVADCVGMSPGAKRGWLEHGMKWSCVPALGALSSSLREKPSVTVIVGAEDRVEAKDRVESETVAVFRANGFKVTTRTEEGCGHMVPVEAPEVVAEELQRMLIR